jgi:hypothetical protein
VRTDLALTGRFGLIPTASRTITETGNSLQIMAAAGRETLNASTDLLHSANERVQDPQIPELIGHLNTASLHIEDATFNANRILLAGAKTSEYYEKKLTTPPRLAKTIIMTGLHLITIPLR